MLCHRFLSSDLLVFPSYVIRYTFSWLTVGVQIFNSKKVAHSLHSWGDILAKTNEIETPTIFMIHSSCCTFLLETLET